MRASRALPCVAMVALTAAGAGAGSSRDTTQEPTAEALVPGTTDARDIAAGETRAYTCRLAAGEYLRVEVVQEHLDLELRLSGPGEPEPRVVDVSYAPAGREPASFLAA